MSTGTIKLDESVHALLKKKGYEYFLILDLELSDEKRICSITVKAERQVPASLKYSCTSIDDPMITSFIYKLAGECEIFVESLE